MKTVLLGIAVMLVLVVGGALYFVYTNLDGLVERAIESAGSAAAGTAVEVESVEVDLFAGSAIIRGFTLANPEGYSAAPLLRFDELAVAIDISAMNRNGSTLPITSIAARNPRLLYELRGGASNLDLLRERMASSEAAPEQAGPELNLTIGRIDIEGIGATVRSDLIANPAEVELGAIHLQNLTGTPNEIASQVLRQMLTQLAASAGRVALTLVPEDLRGAGATLRDAAAAQLEQAGTAVGGATEGLREGLGNLLRRGDAQESEEEDSETSEQ